MRRLLRLTPLIAAVLAGCGSVESLRPCLSYDRFHRLNAPSFTAYVMLTASGEERRADVYMQVPFSRLRFERSDGRFQASLTVTVIVRDGAGTVVHSREYDRTVTADGYAEAHSSRMESVLDRAVLPPGTYEAEVEARDVRSQRSYRSWHPFTLPTMMKAGSVLLVQRAVQDGASLTLRPLLTEDVAVVRDSVGMFQEVYGCGRGDTVAVQVRYETVPPGVPRTPDDGPVWFPPYDADERCGADTGTVKASYDTVAVASSDGTLRLLHFYPGPSAGHTVVARRVIHRSRTGTDTVDQTFRFFLREPRYRNSASAAEVAGALRYILRGEERDSLFRLPEQAMSGWMERFWAERGGRQRRAEFEQRVADAVGLFSDCAAGSGTPMGLVFIVCGPPDLIDCRSERGENWYYTIGERTYTAQFRPRREEGGGASYELVPYSLNEAFWQYHVERWRRR